MHHKKEAPAAKSEKMKKPATTRQALCPVMKGKINKQIFADYKNKRHYFCCAPCKKDFLADPKAYQEKETNRRLERTRGDQSELDDPETAPATYVNQHQHENHQAHSK